MLSEVSRVFMRAIRSLWSIEFIFGYTRWKNTLVFGYMQLDYKRVWKAPDHEISPNFSFYYKWTTNFWLYLHFSVNTLVTVNKNIILTFFFSLSSYSFCFLKLWSDWIDHIDCSYRWLKRQFLVEKFVSCNFE